MFVYRLQHKIDGSGPYRFKKEDSRLEDVRENMFIAHCGNPATPGPYNDGLLGIEGYELFGCPSKRKLQKWFEGFLEEFLKCDYVVVRYKLPKEKARLSKSKLQVAFDPSFAEKVIVKI
jgi:hypothetical protein